MSSFEPWPTVPGGDFRPATPRETEGEGRFRPDVAAATPAPAKTEAAPSEEAAPEPTLEEALARAFEEGREAGRAELPWTDAEALKRARSALEQSAEALARTQSATLTAQRRAVLDLALAVAERFVRRELSSDSDAVLAVVERALSRLEGAEPAVVGLSEPDLETLRSERGEAVTQLADRGVRLEADGQLASGDVVVRAGALHVDARIREVLESLRLELASELPGSDHGADERTESKDAPAGDGEADA